MMKLLHGKLLWLIVCGIAILVGVLSTTFFTMGYIPVGGNRIAENKMSSYKNRPIKAKFDWINSRYMATLDNGYTLSYDLKNNSLHDEQMSLNIDDQVKSIYPSIVEKFPENLKFPEGITVWTMVNADDPSRKAQRLYLLGVYNKDNLSQEESLEIPASIAYEFITHMGEAYHFTGIQFMYADMNGMYEITIAANSSKPIDYETLLESTEKIPEHKLPLDYLEWLEERE